MFILFLSSVWVAEWPPFVKKLLARSTICSLCTLTICNFSYFPLWFEGWILVPIASVPGLCILFTLTHLLKVSDTCKAVVKISYFQ